MTLKKWMLLGVLAFFAPISTVGAQETKETEKEAAVQEKDDKQEAIDKEIKEAVGGYRRVFADLNKKAAEYQKKYGKDRAALEKAFEGLRASLTEGHAKVSEEVVAIVKKGPKSAGARQALMTVLQNGGDANGVAIELLIKHHAEKAGLKRIALTNAMRPGKNSGSILAKIAAADVKEDVKAVAKYGLAAAKTVDFKGTEKEEKAIVSELESIAEEVGDVKIGRQTIEEMSESLIFQFTKLRIGKEAPEITAEDIDGVEFSLSDYRGKVVFLDFWGDW